MTPDWATCARCSHPLYPRLARRTDDGYACADRRGCALRKAQQRRRAQAAQTLADRLEDAAWMARGGETLTGAADRLGVTASALDALLRRHDRALLARLRGNEEAAA